MNSVPVYLQMTTEIALFAEICLLTMNKFTGIHFDQQKLCLALDFTKLQVEREMHDIWCYIFRILPTFVQC